MAGDVRQDLKRKNEVHGLNGVMTTFESVSLPNNINVLSDKALEERGVFNLLTLAHVADHAESYRNRTTINQFGKQMSERINEKVKVLKDHVFGDKINELGHQNGFKGTEYFINMAWGSLGHLFDGSINLAN